MHRVFDFLDLDEARELAEQWAAGRDERLRWLQAQLGFDPLTASLPQLWAAVVAWRLAGKSMYRTGACPTWWIDDEDLDDTHVMADALSHIVCDELRRREPAIQLELLRKRDHVQTNQIVMSLGRWKRTPWALPMWCLERLHPRAPERERGDSLRDDYLESTLRAVIDDLQDWKRELDPAPAAALPAAVNYFDDGEAVLAALDRGADLWSVERFDEDDDTYELSIGFDDVFAHAFSAAIDAAVTALRQADIPGAGDIYRSDRELIIIEAASDAATADVAAVTAATERALRAALASFGRARDE